MFDYYVHHRTVTDKKPIHDQARENRILLNVSNQAKADGYSEKIATEIFKTILAQSNIYESRRDFTQSNKKSATDD